jgi:hypothetical protein
MESTTMQRSPLARVTVGLAGVGLGLSMMVGPAAAQRSRPAPAPATRVDATCTPGVVGKLAARPRNGRIELQFEVESHVAGQTWTVNITDNGTSVHSGTSTTARASGTFNVFKRIADQPGADNLSASATFGGQRCTADLTV